MRILDHRVNKIQNNFHYRCKTEGRETLIILHEMLSHEIGSNDTSMILRCSIRSHLWREQNLPPPDYPWKSSTLPRRSFRTYPFSPLLTSDYRLPRASFRTYATHADTSALKVIAVITEGWSHQGLRDF